MPTAPVASRTERRKFPRKHVIGSQVVSVDVKPQTSSALLLDISEGGFALQNLKTMKPGGTREVSFRIPENGIRVNVSAVVVWKDGDRAGLRLVRVEDASRPALSRWVRTLPDSSRTSNEAAVVQAVAGDFAPQAAVAIRTEPRYEDFYSVAARARIVTCATGAAIAWEDAEGMVCRASTGVAPVTGTRVQLQHGLSGECIRTAAVVRCDDTETDPRVDPDVCRQLNLRSLVIVPIIDTGIVAGLIEVFSNKASAFRNEDVAALKMLAQQCTTGTVAPIAEPRDHTEPLHGLTPAVTTTGRYTNLKFRTLLPWVVGALVLIGGASLAYRHSGAASAANSGPLSRGGDAASAQAASQTPTEVSQAVFGKGGAAVPAIRHGRAISAETKRSPEVVQQNDSSQVTVRQANDAPAPAQEAEQPPESLAPDTAPPSLNVQLGSSDQSALAALTVPHPALPSGPAPQARTISEVTPARLIRSVKPRYPSAARIHNVEGAVLLSLKIDAFGGVKDIKVLSGNPDLAQAAVAAVRQWRYDPFKLNGKPIDGQTSVTVNFSIRGQ